MRKRQCGISFPLIGNIKNDLIHGPRFAVGVSVRTGHFVSLAELAFLSRFGRTSRCGAHYRRLLSLAVYCYQAKPHDRSREEVERGVRIEFPLTIQGEGRLVLAEWGLPIEPNATPVDEPSRTLSSLRQFARMTCVFSKLAIAVVDILTFPSRSRNRVPHMATRRIFAAARAEVTVRC